MHAGKQKPRTILTFACLSTLAFLLMLMGPSAATTMEETRDALAQTETPLLPGVPCEHEEPIPLIELPTHGMPIPGPPEECPGIRPGARLTNGCTMNFLFTDGTDHYMGTAGHCTSFVGQSMGATGIGPFGSVAYRHYSGVGHDFALIRVDDAMVDQLDPNMCAWSGPRDAEPETHAYQPMHHYGWGVATNDQAHTRARTGYLTAVSDTTISFTSYASGGDSGSPATNVLGSGLGILTHVQSNVYGDRVVYGTHIEQAISMAQGAGFDIEIVAGEIVEGVA